MWTNLMMYRRIPKMLLIDLPDGRIGIEFKHTQFKTPKLDEKTCKRFLNGVTHCTIYRIVGIDAHIIGTGVGLCKFPDRFNKSLGRKQALTAVLRKFKQPSNPDSERLFYRDDRLLIWGAYWKSVESVGASAPPIHAPHADVSGNSMEAEG